MKKVILWKSFDPDRLFGGYFWHTERVWDELNNIYSQPFYAEIPDEFSLSENIYGSLVYYKEGCRIGYDVRIGNSDKENSSPYLSGGSPCESIKLKVVGAASDDKAEFEIAVNDWLADHGDQMECLAIREVYWDVDLGCWAAGAEDDKCSYLLTDDGSGSIEFNYVGTKKYPDC